MSDIPTRSQDMITGIPPEISQTFEQTASSERALSGNELRDIAHSSVAATTELTPVTVDRAVIAYDSAREMARQMGIAKADRANRAAAGLPPRTYDLR